jgi:hypothetical protein
VLRACRERPGGYRATEQQYEFAAVHVEHGLLRPLPNRRS